MKKSNCIEKHTFAQVLCIVRECQCLGRLNGNKEFRKFQDILMPVLEPTLTTPWKLTVISIGAITFLIGYVAIGIAYLNQDYAPLKAKQLHV
jgi:hypothetical protein